MTGYFGRQATRRAAVILKIADRYSANELREALADVRRAIVYSFEEAGADIDAERALVETVDAATAILHDRVSSPLRGPHSRSAA